MKSQLSKTSEAKSFLVKDEWLGQILGQDVYRLNCNDEFLNHIKKDPKPFTNLSSQRVFIYTKIPTTQITAAQVLEQNGFFLVDTNVVFKKNVLAQENSQATNEMRFATSSDQDQVANLAKEAFLYSRFHLDPAFSKIQANKIKEEWVKNFFLKKRGDQMVVAVVNNHVVGFTQLIFGKDKVLTIDLIGTDPQFRRRGIAQEMIDFAQNDCSGFDFIRVGTQVANVASVTLYEKMGFRLETSQYVFHYHG